MPLSAPSVVPLALSQSPSRTSSIPSLKKSCTTSLFFSHTWLGTKGAQAAGSGVVRVRRERYHKRACGPPEPQPHSGWWTHHVDVALDDDGRRALAAAAARPADDDVADRVSLERQPALLRKAVEPLLRVRVKSAPCTVFRERSCGHGMLCGVGQRTARTCLHALLVLGRAGDGAELREELPQRRRLQALDGKR